MRHWLYRDARKFYYLDGDVIVIRQNGTVHAYQSFKDNLGSILSVIDENGSKVFSAEYNAWGKQTYQSILSALSGVMEVMRC